MWHQKKAHNINTQPDKFITCEQCGQSFQTLHKLTVHKSLKHKELVTEFHISQEQTVEHTGLQVFKSKQSQMILRRIKFNTFRVRQRHRLVSRNIRI